MNNESPTKDLPLREKFRLFRRNLEHRLRDLLLGLLNLLSLTEERRAVDPHQIRRILILRTGKALGDAVMSLVLIPELNRLAPNARVDLLLRDTVSPLFVDGTDAYQILEFTPRLFEDLGKSWDFFLNLRSQQYDMVIACDHPYKSSLTTLLLALWTGAPIRVGFENDESRSFLTHPVEPTRGWPMIRNLMKLAAPLGEIQDQQAPMLICREKVQSQARNRLGEDPPPIVIFLSNHWRKSWSLSAFMRLTDRLIDSGQKVALTFGPGDRRGEQPEFLSWLEGRRNKVRILPLLPLSEFAAMISQFRLFISNDCGPYHVAVAVGTPVIGIFQTMDAMRDFGYRLEGVWVAVHEPDESQAIQRIVQAAHWLVK